MTLKKKQMEYYNEDNNQDFSIRVATGKDMEYIISLARNEGWNPGLNDATCFYSADNKGFFVAEINGLPIGCISAVKYNTFGFIGLYIIEKQYRRNGYGLALWKKAMDYLSACNIGLDGVVEQQNNYKKSGFRYEHRNVRYRADIQQIINLSKSKNQLAINTNTAKVTEANLFSLAAVNNYDRIHFPENRVLFIKEWINAPENYSLLLIEGDEIRGFGTIRKCFEGFKIAPLFADTPYIAEVLLVKLASYAKSGAVYIDVIEGNTGSELLIKKYKMEPVFQTARMYTKEKPDIKWDQVYGITSFELG